MGVRSGHRPRTARPPPPLAVLGSFDECNSFGGVDLDVGDDHVRVAPRLVFPVHFAGRWLQPGPGLAAPVDLGEPLGDRWVTVEHCVGEGWDECEERERYEPGDLPVAGDIELGCVPSGWLFQAQRDIYDRLDLCDPDAVPTLGIME